LGLLAGHHVVQDDQSQQTPVSQRVGQTLDVTAENAVQAAEALQIGGLQGDRARLPRHGFFVQLVAKDLEDRRIVATSFERVDEAGQQPLLVADSVLLERARDGLAGAKGGEGMEAVFVREQIRQQGAKIVQLGEILFAQTEDEADVESAVVHQLGDRADEFGADAGLVAEADEQLLELIADQNGPGSGGADGLAQVGSFGGAERGAQVGQRLIEGADVDRSQAAGHQLGEDSGKEKRRLAQTRPAVEDQRAGAQDAGHHVTDLAVAAGEKVFVVLAVVVEKFERARRLERCERLDSGAIGHGWPSRAAASRASRSASVSASIHSNPSKRSQKASSTASRWRQAKNAVPRFL